MCILCVPSVWSTRVLSLFFHSIAFLIEDLLCVLDTENPTENKAVYYNVFPIQFIFLGETINKKKKPCSILGINAKDKKQEKEIGRPGKTSQVPFAQKSKGREKGSLEDRSPKKREMEQRRKALGNTDISGASGDGGAPGVSKPERKRRKIKRRGPQKDEILKKGSQAGMSSRLENAAS